MVSRRRLFAWCKRDGGGGWGSKLVRKKKELQSEGRGTRKGKELRENFPSYIGEKRWVTAASIKKKTSLLSNQARTRGRVLENLVGGRR